METWECWSYYIFPYNVILTEKVVIVREKRGVVDYILSVNQARPQGVIDLDSEFDQLTFGNLFRNRIRRFSLSRTNPAICRPTFPIRNPYRTENSTLPLNQWDNNVCAMIPPYYYYR